MLSVVIPIGNLARDFYNLTETIKQSCLADVELIFVLDTDEEKANVKLRNLCKAEHQAKFSVFKCSERNPGASRNIGITNATGEWIAFCDSDDTPNFKKIVDAINEVQDNYDVIIGSFEIEKKSSNYISKHLVGDGSALSWESISHNPGVWRWITRNSFIHSVAFPELSMGEDQCFILRILQRNPEIKFSQEFFYKYKIGFADSITTNLSKIDDLISVIKIELAISDFPREYMSVRNNMIFRQILTLLYRGNFKTKFRAIYLMIEFTFTISPKNYLSITKFMLKAFTNRFKHD
jgi:glycosyltransferase involved in cell wall biosynthesis